MKKFIISTMVFIPLALIAYIFAVALWGDYGPKPFRKNINYKLGSKGHLFSRVREIEKFRNVDILFLGSSHTYRGFDTRIFANHGFRTFNLGSSSQTPMQTEVLLKRYLDILNPKLIIYEVYPVIFQLDGVESSLDIISNDENDFLSIGMALRQNHLKVYNTLIYGFYRDIRNRNSSYKEEILKGEDKYVEGGFVEKIAGEKTRAVIDTVRSQFNSMQFDIFESILEMLKQRNIPVILVQAPVTDRLYMTYEDPESFDQRMTSYGSYYNFNRMTELNDSLHFFDFDHLNQSGVEIFNRDLINILKYRNK